MYFFVSFYAFGTRLNVGGTKKSWVELEQAELVYP